ncbi:unnamed protein product [Mytilus coruscus]|uniref:Uncharacterized protein n=1 Tax=Mytilus coruscus TaxID=42192 RepID=A0A6J8A1S4_MYTCO|nr:unnamed protein product [Mytilus coruscus]
MCGNGLNSRYEEKNNSVIIDCVIIDELVVFLCNVTDRLIIQNRGRFERAIKLSGKPRGITVINDKDVAVLYYKSLIVIISIDTGRVQNEIIIRNDSKGISYQNDLLFINFSNECTIDVMNLEGDRIRSFLCPSSPGHHSLQGLVININKNLRCF